MGGLTNVKMKTYDCQERYMNTIWIAFITGLTAGGISCLAVQGGLLASALSNVPTENKRQGTALFIGSKIISYSILGALLGFFGSSLSITSTVQGWLQVIAGIYMLATAANLLELHPVFRYVVIQPPKWAYKLLKKESHKEIIGTGILGALTVLVPCGITQGMMILAISSGNAITGALILAAFTIGTSPMFFALGVTASEFMKRKAFVYAASALIIVLGVNSISAGNALRGSSQTIANYWKVLTNQEDSKTTKQTLATLDKSGNQEVTIQVTSNGYMPLASTLKVGVPVKLKLVSNNVAGCVQVFTMPTYNIKKLLPRNGEEEIAFTPTKTGRLPFSCAMGMFTGEFQVI